MLTKFKKSFTIALAVVMCLTAVCASAEWRIKDYDTTNIVVKNGIVPSVPIVYEEYDAQGNFTGRYADINKVNGFSFQNPIELGLRPYAQAEFKNPWFDITFPNAEYASVYADGINLGVCLPTGRLGTQNNIEYKDVDYMWEVAAPFGIYSITKAKLNINGVAQWFGTPEFNYPVNYTGRNAEVKVQRFPYGFSAYKVTGDNQVELAPADLFNGGYVDASIVSGVVLDTLGAADLLPSTTPSVRKMVNKTGLFVVPKAYDYALIGPAYDEVGNEIPGGKTITASTYFEGKLPDRFAELNSFGVADLLDTVLDRDGNVTLSAITWTAGGYELVSPHYVYEYLTIDGVVMDGSYIGNVNGVDYWRPCIAAFTGAVATIY